MVELNAHQPQSFKFTLFRGMPIMTKDFYVYLHRRKTDNIVFYVGKGRGRRAHYLIERNDHWTKTFKKHGCIVEIVHENISEQDAFDIEKKLIEQYKTDKLCNKTDGGEGISGYKFTESQKKNLSESHKSHAVTDDVKKRISQSLKGRVNPPHVRAFHRERMKGNTIGALRVITAELRAKLREANKGEKSHTADKTVYKFKHKDGRLFEGTRYELKEKHGDCVRALFYTKPNKSVYGWSLVS